MADENDTSSSQGGGGAGDTDSERRAGLLSEAVKKIFTVGVSAAFMTEESLRNYLGDIKLPRELLQSLLQGASKSKDEIAQRISNEAIKMLSKIDFTKEATKFIETHKFKISAEIEFLKKDKKSDDSRHS